MPDLILIADDLTGAADTAAPFAVQGLPARLIFDRDAPPESGVTAISTESREQETGDAERAVLDACAWVKHHDKTDALLFKKIDSTLRGHVSAELSVVVEQFGIDRLLLTPAFPAQGRTTLEGRHLVHAVPLGQSSFGIDEDDLISLFADVAGLPVLGHSLETVRGESAQLAPRLAQPGIHIPDIETDADMDQCVGQALEAGITRFCGAAGLGRALATRLGPKHRDQHETTSLQGPVLFVAGSRNQATIDQVAAVGGAGVPVVSLCDGEDGAARTAAGYIRNGSSVVLSSTAGRPELDEPRKVREAMAEVVGRLLAGARPGLMLLTGGDIAAATCQRLGVKAIGLRGEIEPGIPIGVLESGDGPGLPVVTKAGGFGDPGTLLRLLESVGRK